MEQKQEAWKNKKKIEFQIRKNNSKKAISMTSWVNRKHEKVYLHLCSAYFFMAFVLDVESR